MQFTQYDLGHCSRGEIIEVTLTNGANVRLMDNSNFSAFKQGRSYRFQGGLATRSPVRLQVPHSSHWYVTVDVDGLRNGTRSSVRKIPGPLPEIREAPLSTVPSLVRDVAPEALALAGAYDVFISHASEDKEEIVRELATAIRSRGLKVWYDEFELRIGDSLRRKIDHGLANSRVGLVILSEAFFKKGWTNYELDGIVSRSVNGEQQLLPIWHKVSKADVMRFSPSLVDKVARSTLDNTPDEIATEIAELLDGR
ncbi:DUF1883 domain-containing protein [Mesorhizobium sp. WSM3626]|uniref:DUF1883 domain-containing protein n=1 Tax=Mesorhizobium sp. WSM3626 TaxID=1040987 RepID=UPI0004854E57|nr:DUF1883 domain-containing protein [Mesorhizobium sp. WSM3626]